MIKLFNIDKKTNRVTLDSDEILLVKEFREIWESDSSKNKENAFKLFGYLFLVCDYRSLYREYKDEDKRQAAKKDMNLDIDDLLNPLLSEAEIKYKEILESNKMIALIHSMYKAVDELNKYFRTVDFSKLVESGAQKGKMLYSPSELHKILKESGTILTSLENLEDKLKEQFNEETSVRGGVDISDIFKQ